MKALSVVAPHHVEVIEQPIPDMRDDESLVKVAAATICHTDHYILSGNHPFARYPVTPGHEFSGVVQAVGSKVTYLTPGTASPSRPSCPAITAGSAGAVRSIC